MRRCASGRRSPARLVQLSVATALAALATTAGIALGGSSVAPTGSALAALAAPPKATSLASQRIYFVLPDRYRNGDPSNDRAGVPGSRSANGFDPADTGWYHGGDLRGLTGGCTDPDVGLQRIKNLGFTAVWVAPVVKQRWVQGSSAAYHGYWGVDFTTVDPHLGTDADFGAFVECAHTLGLKVYLDVVVNHTADVIQPIGGASYSDGAYRDCRGVPFLAARYATGSTFPCLSAQRSFPRTPNLPAGDRNAKRPTWLNDVRRYHNRGDIDWASCSATCFEQGDFYGLDDLFTEQPAVADGLAAIYADWIRRVELDGFRVDTARHVNAAFFGRWVPKIMAAARAAGVNDFQLFGEVFTTNAIELSGYVQHRGLPEVLDFPLQDALVRFAGGSAGSRGIAVRLADDDYFRRPNGLLPSPATFLGNHDIGRAARVIDDQTVDEGDALLERVLLGHDLLFLLRGAPAVLYGDEVGIEGQGGDKEARQDLFPTQVKSWQTEPRIGSPPIGAGSSFDVVDNPVGRRIRLLSTLRAENPALATGSSIVRLGQGQQLVVSRIDRDARRELVVAFNQGESSATVSVRTSTPSSTWTPLLAGTPIVSGARGELRLTIPPRGTALFRADAALPNLPAVAPKLTAGTDELTGLRVLRAAATTTDPVTVAFAVRRGTGSWRRVSVDDAPPYRAFLDPLQYRKRESVEAVAVLRASNGSVAVSPVVRLVPRP